MNSPQAKSLDAQLHVSDSYDEKVRIPDMEKPTTV